MGSVGSAGRLTGFSTAGDCTRAGDTVGAKGSTRSVLPTIGVVGVDCGAGSEGSGGLGARAIGVVGGAKGLREEGVAYGVLWRGMRRENPRKVSESIESERRERRSQVQSGDLIYC